MPTLLASPLPEPTVAPSPSEPDMDPAEASAAAPPEVAEPASQPPSREPTDAARARFVAAYRPEGAIDLESAAGDLDGDGTAELVFLYAVNGRVHVDVAAWRGGAYEIVTTQQGAEAEHVDDLRVGDLNGDGRVEVAALQSTASRSSLSLWRVDEGLTLGALEAEGGCWDGSSTYGILGVSLEDHDGDGRSEIVATCDDSPLPVGEWRTERYAWRDGAYRPVPAGTGAGRGTGTVTGSVADPGADPGTESPGAGTGSAPTLER